VTLTATTAHAQGFSPAEAAAHMTSAAGLKVRLFASEPRIRQPVAIEFDDRGRLWVIQYLQYPNPAGLKRVTVDRYSRTTYDRLPEPPPRGPKGADRITILEDTDGDGLADSSKDFLTGLNLASGLAFGYGGVFVLQTPYLLFYPDRNRDDVPDGDPEVLVTGFGMEDAHSVANSLTWGPDGWLYGLQGSTVTARIGGIEFQQGVWRFHPVTRKFELFSEGGGNMWGLDFDRRGNLFASSNIGSSAMLHAVQGGYYWKSFGKHGPLHNPYTFGYFEHVRHEAVQGGHVSVGGLFYDAEAFPAQLRGKYLSGDLLDHSAHWHDVTPLGSTFSARQRGDLLRANDTWFAPTDMTLGPDGSVYISDWHDRRTAHPDPDADWDRSNGRVFALDGPGRKPHSGFDLAVKSSAELIALLEHPNLWYVRKARRIIAERLDPGVSRALLERATTHEGSSALEALWGAYGAGGFDDVVAARLLAHRDADVRAWTVRLLGNDADGLEARIQASPTNPLRARLIELAERDPSVTVRAALACFAQRSSCLGLPIAFRILQRDLDRNDPHIPLLLWWALERQASGKCTDAMSPFLTARWDSAMMREAMAKLMRRYAAEDGTCCARLLDGRTERERTLLLGALDDALMGRAVDRVAATLKETIFGLAREDVNDPTLTRLAARFGEARARDRVLARARSSSAPESSRVRDSDFLGDLAATELLQPLLNLAIDASKDSVRLAALRALGRFDDPAVAPALLAAYPTQPAAWQSHARDLFFGRKTWARPFLDAVERGQVRASDVPLAQIARVSLLADPSFDQLVKKHWGRVTGGTPEEKLAEVRRLNNDLRAGAGERDRGHALFVKHCATCHRLFNEGNSVGPELTLANRNDRDFLLVSLIDPNAVIRKEYQATVLHTRDGRVLTGLIAEQTPDRLTLVDAKNERVTVKREDIDDMADSPSSLMPESLYREFNPDQLRDLFAYLQSERPAPQ
jgi:putative membrane-bound dehydrogenase-like protein